MTPTQEQIEAALRYVDGIESHDDKEVLLLSSDELHTFSMAAAVILTTAYRELQEENKQLKAWADLAISSNASLEIQRLKKP